MPHVDGGTRFVSARRLCSTAAIPSFRKSLVGPGQLCTVQAEPGRAEAVNSASTSLAIPSRRLRRQIRAQVPRTPRRHGQLDQADALTGPGNARDLWASGAVTQAHSHGRSDAVSAAAGATRRARAVAVHTVHRRLSQSEPRAVQVQHDHSAVATSHATARSLASDSAQPASPVEPSHADLQTPRMRSNGSALLSSSAGLAVPHSDPFGRRSAAESRLQRRALLSRGASRGQSNVLAARDDRPRWRPVLSGSLVIDTYSLDGFAELPPTLRATVPYIKDFLAGTAGKRAREDEAARARLHQACLERSIRWQLDPLAHDFLDATVADLIRETELSWEEHHSAESLQDSGPLRAVWVNFRVPEPVDVVGPSASHLHANRGDAILSGADLLEGAALPEFRGASVGSGAREYAGAESRSAAPLFGFGGAAAADADVSSEIGAAADLRVLDAAAAVLRVRQQDETTSAVEYGARGELGGGREDGEYGASSTRQSEFHDDGATSPIGGRSGSYSSVGRPFPTVSPPATDCFVGVQPMDDHLRWSMEHEPLRPATAGLTFESCDIRNGPWRSHLVLVSEGVSLHEDDVLFPNQVLHAGRLVRNVGPVEHLIRFLADPSTKLMEQHLENLYNIRSSTSGNALSTYQLMELFMSRWGTRALQDVCAAHDL